MQGKAVGAPPGEEAGSVPEAGWWNEQETQSVVDHIAVLRPQQDVAPLQDAVGIAILRQIAHETHHAWRIHKLERLDDRWSRFIQGIWHCLGLAPSVRVPRHEALLRQHFIHRGRSDLMRLPQDHACSANYPRGSSVADATNAAKRGRLRSSRD